MKIRLIIGVAGLLLSGAPVLAQGEKTSAATTSPMLPGEEKLSDQERAERDFLMPVRRKQAAALQLAAQEEAAATQTAAEMIAHHPEVAEEVKAPEAEAAVPPRVAPRSPARRKTVHRSSSSKTKSASARRR